MAEVIYKLQKLMEAAQDLFNTHEEQHNEMKKKWKKQHEILTKKSNSKAMTIAEQNLKIRKLREKLEELKNKKEFFSEMQMDLAEKNDLVAELKTDEKIENYFWVDDTSPKKRIENLIIEKITVEEDIGESDISIMEDYKDYLENELERNDIKYFEA